MSSLGAKVVFWILRIGGAKQYFARQARKPSRRPEFVPDFIKSSIDIEQRQCCQRTIATLSSKSYSSRKHIIYLHGGAYIFEASTGHWMLVSEMTKQLGVRVSMIDYPLAPEHNYQQTLHMLILAYQALVQAYPDDEFILAGDSAGGGVALALAQQLAEQSSLRQPILNVLFSPWLDLSLKNPDLEVLAANDHLLSLDVLRQAANAYAGDTHLEDPLLSPLYGDLTQIAKTLVLYGSQELLRADCEVLQQRALEQKADFKFESFADMQHAWVVFPIQERRLALEFVARHL